jgi:hypothetical protein
MPMDANLDFLSTRKGFNTSLKHFKLVNSFIKKLDLKQNLADIINNALEEKKVDLFQYSSILNALLIEKYKYYTESFNLKTTYSDDLMSISKQLKDWDKVDVVLVYYHPQLGQILINPKNEESWESVGQLKENELIVIYVGYFNNIIDENIACKAINAIRAIISNEKVSNTKIFKGSPMIVEKPKEEPKKKIKIKKVENIQQPQQEKELAMQKPNDTPNQGPSGSGSPVKKKLSPHYGVLVSNELFHNGNVEAWKKIIASYELKYTDTKVLVFYEGEQIQDINTLFKWGKVKHGTNIYFALLGPEFRDVSKLRRYLAQGASNRFEDFLRGDPTKTLNLF